MRYADRGLAYLHGDGVLHLDIKPDNVLVFSLDEVLTVNGKLTVFGTSRNVNMLTANMTFTKGVGTPTYMAPEVLNQGQYKKSADVYSFSAMLYECFQYGEANPRTPFKFTWRVFSFVQSGRRVERPKEMVYEVFRVVQCFLNTTSLELALSSMTGTTLDLFLIHCKLFLFHMQGDDDWKKPP